MSTIAEIEAALPALTPEELFHVETVLRRVRRAKCGGVIMDDDYGLWTEEDQASAASEAWAILDGPKPA